MTLEQEIERLNILTAYEFKILTLQEAQEMMLIYFKKILKAGNE